GLVAAQIFVAGAAVGRLVGVGPAGIAVPHIDARTGQRRARRAGEVLHIDRKVEQDSGADRSVGRVDAASGAVQVFLDPGGAFSLRAGQIRARSGIDIVSCDA